MISETRRKATWQELADRVDELQTEVKSLKKENEELRKISKMIESYPIDSSDNTFILIEKREFFNNPYLKNLLDDYISKDKIKDCFDDIEDYFERVSVPYEDIEFIKEKRNDLLKEE